MPTNVDFEFQKAQEKYLSSKTDKERLGALEEMMKTMPKHKSAESLRKNIRTRYKKLKQEIERRKTKKTGKKEGIKKEGIQVVLCGLTNSGKSSLLSILTNAKPPIASYQYTTKEPLIGTLDYEGIKFQVIDTPAVNYETFDQGLANTCDILLITAAKIGDIEKILPFLNKAHGKKIIIFNKSDLLNNEQKRKIEATLKSKKHNFVIISTKTQEGIEQLKEVLAQESGVIRIYTKQPHKSPDSEPIILKPPVTIKDLAEGVLKKGIKIKEARVTGPSSKFPNQKVGLKHELKDKDIVEFHTG